MELFCGTKERGRSSLVIQQATGSGFSESPAGLLSRRCRKPLSFSWYPGLSDTQNLRVARARQQACFLLTKRRPARRLRLHLATWTRLSTLLTMSLRGLLVATWSRASCSLFLTRPTRVTTWALVTCFVRAKLIPQRRSQRRAKAGKCVLQQRQQ